MCGQKYLYALHLVLIVDNNGFQSPLIRAIKFITPRKRKDTRERVFSFSMKFAYGELNIAIAYEIALL